MKKIFNLENFIYLAVLAIPLSEFKFTLFGIPTDIFEILILIGLSALLTRKERLKIELGGQGKYLWGIGLILIGLLLSTSISGAWHSGLGVIKGWFLVPLAFSWLASTAVPSGKSENVWKALFWSAFLVSSAALAYFFSGIKTFDGRLEAFYNSPNYLAMYIAPAILIGAVLFRQNRKLYGASLAVMITALYLTFSYAAWLALFASALIAIAMQKKTLKKAALVAGAVAVIFGIFIFFQAGSVKMDNLIHLKARSSAASRMMIWHSAARILQDNWIFGIGPNRFQEKYLEYQKYFPPYLEWSAPEPHNLFLAFWLQAGLIGLVSFLALLYFWFRDVFSRKADAIQVISIAVMAYILIHGIADTTYFKQDLAAVFWLNFIMAIRRDR